MLKTLQNFVKIGKNFKIPLYLELRSFKTPLYLVLSGPENIKIWIKKTLDMAENPYIAIWTTINRYRVVTNSLH